MVDENAPLIEAFAEDLHRAWFVEYGRQPTTNELCLVLAFAQLRTGFEASGNNWGDLRAESDWLGTVEIRQVEVRVGQSTQVRSVAFKGFVDSVDGFQALASFLGEAPSLGVKALFAHARRRQHKAGTVADLTNAAIAIAAALVLDDLDLSEGADDTDGYIRSLVRLRVMLDDANALVLPPQVAQFQPSLVTLLSETVAALESL